MAGLLSYMVTFFLLPALLVGLDFTYSESIAGSPGQRLVPLVLLFFVSPILARLSIAYNAMEILAVMSTFVCWNYVWCQMAHLLYVSMSFAFPIDQLPLPVTVSLSVFATILVFLLTEYIFYKLLRFSEGEAGVFENFHAYIWGVLSFLRALALFTCFHIQEGAEDRGDLGRVGVDGAVILLGNDGAPADRVDGDGGVDNYVNRTGMAEVTACMFLPPYHQIAGIDYNFAKFHSDII